MVSTTLRRCGQTKPFRGIISHDGGLKCSRFSLSLTLHLNGLEASKYVSQIIEELSLIYSNSMPQETHKFRNLDIYVLIKFINGL